MQKAIHIREGEKMQLFLVCFLLCKWNTLKWRLGSLHVHARSSLSTDGICYIISAAIHEQGIFASDYVQYISQTAGFYILERDKG